MTFCPCNTFSEIATGGFTIGGSATVTSTNVTVSGGMKIGGSASVSIGGLVYDEIIIYPLDEVGAGVAGEYRDRGIYALHGTGIVSPTIVDGVFCLPASYFEEEVFSGNSISLPADPFSTSSELSVSMWVKLFELYKPRALYSRGYQDTDGNEWVFYVGTSWLNHIVCSVQMFGNIVYECYSNITLDLDRNYHIACTFKPASQMEIFIDGVSRGSEPITESTTLTNANGGFIGQWNIAAFPTCNLQELRIYPSINDANYWEAEHDNFCSAGFFSVGSEENPLYS